VPAGPIGKLSSDSSGKAWLVAANALYCNDSVKANSFVPKGLII
jgi:hypothetical protein